MPVTETAKSRRRTRQRAFGHRARDLGADRAVRGDQRRRHAEHLGLGVVRVGDEAALEPVARAGERGAGGGDQAAGARLGGRDAVAAAAQQRAGEARDQRGDRRRSLTTNLHSAITSSVQSAATRSSNRMPKPCAQPIGAPRRSLKRWSAQATGPGLAASKKRNSAKATACAPEAGRRDQPEHEPEGDDLVPDDRRRDRPARDGARSRCRPTSRASVAPASTQRPRAVVEQRRSDGTGEPGPQRADGARRDRRQAAAEAERDGCAGWASRKRQSGLRPAPRSGGLSAGSVLTTPAPASRRGSDRTRSRAPTTARPRASTKRSAGPASIAADARDRRAGRARPRRRRHRAVGGGGEDAARSRRRRRAGIRAAARRGWRGEHGAARQRIDLDARRRRRSGAARGRGRRPGRRRRRSRCVAMPRSARPSATRGCGCSIARRTRVERVAVERDRAAERPRAPGGRRRACR